MAIISKAFRDFNLKFSSNPFTGDIQVLKDVDAIKNSIISLLKTNIGERPFQPNLGSRMNSLLFEPVDYLTAAAIKTEIETTIKNFEPRALLKMVTVYEKPDNNAYEVSLEFFIGNNTQPTAITLTLERTR